MFINTMTVPVGMSKEIFDLDPALYGRVQLEERGAVGHCWRWQGGHNEDGYGRFRKQSTHRRSYELANGPIPQGLNILHRCHCRDCINPAHLYAGTQADNARDRVEAGRMPPIVRKLTIDDARAILANREKGYKALAIQYDVMPHHTRSILNGNKWKRAQREQDQSQYKMGF